MDDAEVEVWAEEIAKLVRAEDQKLTSRFSAGSDGIIARNSGLLG
jgi:hypothetical protein